MALYGRSFGGLANCFESIAGVVRLAWPLVNFLCLNSFLNSFLGSQGPRYNVQLVFTCSCFKKSYSNLSLTFSL